MTIPAHGVCTYPTPLTFAQRITRYTANRRRLTPRQTRRLHHKANQAIKKGAGRLMGKHSKDGEHHCGQTAKDTGYTGKHREAPVFEVRSPAEQAAYIKQQQRTPLHRRPCPPPSSPVNGVESTGTGGPDPVPGCGRVGSATKQIDTQPTPKGSM